MGRGSLGQYLSMGSCNLVTTRLTHSSPCILALAYPNVSRRMNLRIDVAYFLGRGQFHCKRECATPWLLGAASA